MRVSYDCSQRFINFRFYIPPEGRNSLPIPGGYENNVWPYTYIPIPGKEQKFYIINRVEGHKSMYNYPHVFLVSESDSLIDTVNLAFSGWGDPELPRSLDDILDWFKKFEIDHAKVPEWVYALVDKLFDYSEHCEILPAKYRMYHLIQSSCLIPDYS